MILSKLALSAAALPMTLGGFHAPLPDAHHSDRAPIMAEAAQAILDNDFDAWYNAVTKDDKNPFSTHATREVFDTLENIHTAVVAKDYKTAQSLWQGLAKTLGIDETHNTKSKGRQHARSFAHDTISKEDKILLHQAMVNGDYESWKSIMDAVLPDSSQDRLTEKQFNKMVDWMKKHDKQVAQGV